MPPTLVAEHADARKEMTSAAEEGVTDARKVDCRRSKKWVLS